MFCFMHFVHFFMNYAIFRELCDQMRFEVDCAKSHHRVIPEGLIRAKIIGHKQNCKQARKHVERRSFQIVYSSPEAFLSTKR